MKKLALILLGVLIGVIGSHLVNNEPEVAPKMEEPVKSQKVTDVKSEDSMQVSKPKGIISKQRAKDMSKAYDRRYKIISGNLGREDNRSVWFSIDEIESFLGYTQYEAKYLLDQEYKVNGVRVYMAAYPEDNLNQDKAGYTTVFMVPTYDATESKSNVLPVNAVLKTADVPDGSPLNEGTLGDPPSATYPN